MKGKHIISSTAGETVKAYVPMALAAVCDGLEVDDELSSLSAAAEKSLAALELLGRHTPSVEWIIIAFARREAVSSSRIEGTKASLVDLYRHEASPKKKTDPDFEELFNYIVGQDYAWSEMVRPKGLPLSMRLLNNTHERLMQGVRGQHKQPGEIRRSQVWIGGSRPGNASYVPPPIDRLPALLTDLEQLFHDDDSELPPLVRIGLIHAQFEMIHPYLDGNGRIGRMLIALLLRQWSMLSQPILYLSSFFYRFRGEYYERLKLVSSDGDWRSWLLFFLRGVESTADEATGMIGDVMTLVNKDRSRLRDHGSVPAAAWRLFEHLPRHPLVTAQSAARMLDIHETTATRAIDALVELKILSLITESRRNRIFVYAKYLDLVSLGTGDEQDNR